MHAFNLPESVSFYHVVPRIKTSLTSLLTCCAISPAHKYRLKGTLKSNDTDIQNKSSDWLKFLWEHPSNKKTSSTRTSWFSDDWPGQVSPLTTSRVALSKLCTGKRRMTSPWNREAILQPRECSCQASCALTRPQLLQCTQQYLVPATEVTPSIFPSYSGTKLEVNEKVLGILNLWKQSKHIQAYF